METISHHGGRHVRQQHMHFHEYTSILFVQIEKIYRYYFPCFLGPFPPFFLIPGPDIHID